MFGTEMISSLRITCVISLLAVSMTGCSVTGNAAPRTDPEPQRLVDPVKNPVLSDRPVPHESVSQSIPLPKSTNQEETLLAPDAIALVNPKYGSVTPESETELMKMVHQIQSDERLLVRLESFVPGGSSASLDIGMAENILKTVRAKLQSMGITSRRILSSSYGGEHSIQRASMPWVELYLVRHGYATIEASRSTLQK